MSARAELRAVMTGGAKASRLPRWQQTPRRPVRGMLVLLDWAEIRHRRLDATLWHADRCPSCWGHGLYINDDHGGELGVACWNECADEDILAALQRAAGVES